MALPKGSWATDTFSNIAIRTKAQSALVRQWLNKASVDIKAYINDTLTPAIDTALANKVSTTALDDLSEQIETAQNTAEQANAAVGDLEIAVENIQTNRVEYAGTTINGDPYEIFINGVNGRRFTPPPNSITWYELRIVGVDPILDNFEFSKTGGVILTREGPDTVIQFNMTAGNVYENNILSSPDFTITCTCDNATSELIILVGGYSNPTTFSAILDYSTRTF